MKKVVSSISIAVLAFATMPGLVAQTASGTNGSMPQVVAPEIKTYPRPVENWLEAQIALDRLLVSCGSIDGKAGAQTVAALRAFQESEGLDASGRLDKGTTEILLLDAPPFTTRTITAEDLAGLQPVSPTWLGKSQQTSLAYATILELVAEQSHAHPQLIRQLNPGITWDIPGSITAGTIVKVPDVALSADAPILRSEAKAARIIIHLEGRTLEAFADGGQLLAHFPVSIARNVEKRPVGVTHVTVVIREPNYTFDPEVFPESAEGRELGRKLIIPPGPNNPVGLVWIGLDHPGYGIHGTPDPEKVGRTESHGCFRLANWNAMALTSLVEVGTEVNVIP